jgi:hypothetical protein
MKNGLAVVQLACVTGGASLLIAVFLFMPNNAKANMAIMQKTGAACPVCHTAPPELNDAGKKYKATGKLD